ncbi:sugar phosphate isomerase/epimerase [Verrucomicrobiales bacterium]|nr:sugar phosphate isomerase/epimerase [Verrucomicrobiales bacterium]MDC0258606.1 sugar phosphate isomerase/epimerase [Verrucomicrobiales bacterium]
MGRPVTLFTGQWADLECEAIITKAKEMGYDGVEFGCWGDHFEVDKADADYCKAKRDLLSKHGMSAYSISSHLVGQAVCDRIDERHAQILPEYIYGDGDPEGVRQRAAEELKKTAIAAKEFGVDVVNGFTGSSIWHLLYSFPPNLPGQIDAGYKDFADRFGPIMDVFQENGIKFGLEVHPTEIAFDIASAQRALEAIDFHPAFGFNYDPSHFGYQGVDYVEFIYKFADRINHVHMKDVSWSDKPTEAGVFGGHVDFHKRNRFWDFKSVGRGNINFEKIIRALNDIGYQGPLSVEWEDGAMDRVAGATESAAFCKQVDFPVSDIVFDAQFDKENQ